MTLNLPRLSKGDPLFALSPNKVLALEPGLPPVWPAGPSRTQQNAGGSYSLQSSINLYPVD